jgi:hypothetical protein
MTDEFEVKVGNFGMTFHVPSGRGEFINYSKEDSSSVSLRDVLDLGISVERGLWRLADRLLHDRGLALFSRLKEENPHVSAEELFQQMLETIPSGEASEEGATSSRWILAFVQENKTRPDLLSRMLCALKARECTVRDFFLAYVYSNTENIAANLHFFDYLRAHESEHEERPETNDELCKTAKALLTDMRFELSIKDASADHQALWQSLEDHASTWSSEDVLALERLSRLIHSSRHFVSLAGLAQSVRPLAMYHYFQYLTFAGARDWVHVLRSEREFSVESLHGHYLMIDIAIAGLLSDYGYNPVAQHAPLSLTDAERVLKRLALAPQGGLAQLVVSAIDYSSFPSDGAERLAKALSFLVPATDIQQHAEAARSLQ